MKIIETDGFRFCFEDALDAFVFDEKDRSKPTFHGAPMKSVDIIAEFAEGYVYVELKDYDDPSICDVLSATTEDEKKLAAKSLQVVEELPKIQVPGFLPLPAC